MAHYSLIYLENKTTWLVLRICVLTFGKIDTESGGGAGRVQI